MLDNCSSIEENDIFITLNKKNRSSKIALSRLIKEYFGYIFKKLLIRKKNVRLKEEIFKENPNAENRMVFQRHQVELKR